MKEIIHNSWQTVLSAEFENRIIKNCGNFEKNIRHKRFIQICIIYFQR